MNKEQENLIELYDDKYEIKKQKEAVLVAEKLFNEKRNIFVKSYFEKYGVSYTHNIDLPINDKTFISNPTFDFKKSEDGNIFWIAAGRKITIKNNKATYGTSTQDLWQGQWEALPPQIQKLTVKDACAIAKAQSVFDMSPAIFKGCLFGGPAYILHNDPALQWQLVWRKAGTSYGGRMSSVLSTPSGLQLLYVGTESNKKSAMNSLLTKATGNEIKYASDTHNLTEGGKLSAGFIESETFKIDTIFGDGTAKTIISKIKLQQNQKLEVRKSLKKSI